MFLFFTLYSLVPIFVQFNLFMSELGNLIFCIVAKKRNTAITLDYNIN